MIHCAETAAQSLDVLPAVESALATSSWESALLQLVAKWGEAAVDCAVQHAEGAARADIQVAPSDTVAPVRAEHAHAWLASRPYTVQK